MADIKWDAFPAGGTLLSSDTIVGYVSGVNNYSYTFASIPTASAISSWDANKNLSANSFIPGYTSTPTAASTTVLTVSSTQLQYFTGSTTQTVTMPVVSTLVLGMYYRIVNLSSGNVTTQSSGANTLQVLAPNSSVILTCVAITGTGTSSWDVEYVADTGGVTSITGTTSQVIVNAGALPGAVVLSTPQNIATTSSPTFASLTTANMSFDVTANTIKSTNTNGNINITPNGQGEVLLGTATAIAAQASNTFRTQVALSGKIGALTIGAFSNTAGGPATTMYKSRSTSIGTFATVNNGDTLGNIIFLGDDGTTFNNAASIAAKVAAAPSTGIMPAQLAFSTTSTSGNLTPAMTITDAQIVTVANAVNYGIDTGIADAYIVNLSSTTVLELTDGLPIIFTALNANVTSSPTLTINEFTAPIARQDGGSVSAGDISGYLPSNLIYSSEAGSWLLLNATVSNVQAGQLQNAEYISASDSGSANAYNVTFDYGGAVGSFSPNVGAQVSFMPAHSNTGASTLEVEGESSTAITLINGSALTAGMMLSSKYALLTYCVTTVGSLTWVLTNPQGGPAASASSSLSIGSAYQNTAGYDIMLTVYLSVTAATSATITLGVGSTSTPTAQTIVGSFSTAALSIITVPIYLPHNYYALLNTTGTITVSISGQQAMAI